MEGWGSTKSEVIQGGPTKSKWKIEGEDENEDDGEGSGHDWEFLPFRSVWAQVGGPKAWRIEVSLIGGFPARWHWVPPSMQKMPSKRQVA